MVEWSKTWDLSCSNFPITQVARVRTPLLSSCFFQSFLVLSVHSKKTCATHVKYIESKCENGGGISKYKINKKKRL